MDVPILMELCGQFSLLQQHGITEKLVTLIVIVYSVTHPNKETKVIKGKPSLWGQDILSQFNQGMVIAP